MGFARYIYEWSIFIINTPRREAVPINIRTNNLGVIPVTCGRVMCLKHQNKAIGAVWSCPKILLVGKPAYATVINPDIAKRGGKEAKYKR